MPNVKIVASLREAGGGELVHEYDQGKDTRLNQIDITENGWCLGQSVQWLRYKKTGGDFWPWFMKNDGAGAVRFIMASQAIRTKVADPDGLNWAERAEFALKNFGIKKDKVYQKKKPNAKIDAMAADIANQPGKFVRIGFGYDPKYGHSVAAFVDGESVTFMDPNAGEFHFTKKADFVKWLPLFWKAINYNPLRYYDVEHYNA